MSNTTNNNNIPGMLYPTQRGMLAGNPRDSAILQGNIDTQKLVALNAIGGKKHFRRGGAANNNIVIPQFTMQYIPQGGIGQDPNSIIRQNAAVSTQGAANSVYDKYATQKGGFYMNMNTNKYDWGCYSGGKKAKKKTKKRRKLNKKKRTRKLRRKIIKN
jgi:hypothetical protein